LQLAACSLQLLLRRITAFGDGTQDDLALIFAVFADVGFRFCGFAANHIDQQALEQLQGNVEFRGVFLQGNKGVALEQGDQVGSVAISTKWKAS